MAQFYPLQVTDIRKDTRHAVIVTLQPPNGEEDRFTFTQGQYLTFRQRLDGEDVRRSYSICCSPNEGCLQVGIKHVEGGIFSGWANERLAVGDTIEAMAPMGNFFRPLEPEASNQYLGFAAGSGITPLVSIISAILENEPHSHFTLVYGNRSANTVMFRKELGDLKSQYMERLSVVHVLSTNGGDIDLFNGRIDRVKTEELFQNWIQIEDVTCAFICGPEEMMLTVSDVLKSNGLSSDQIKYELFATGRTSQQRPKRKAGVNSGSPSHIELAIQLDGNGVTFEAPREKSILESALEQGMDAPHSCKAGVCSTCKCRVLEGEVEMLNNHALEDYEVAQGYALSCQSYAISDRIVVEYSS